MRSAGHEKRWIAGFSAVVLAVGIFIGQALAGGVPTQSPLTWAGVVTI